MNPPICARLFVCITLFFLGTGSASAHAPVDCETLARAVSDAAHTEAVCTVDTDCVGRAIPICNVSGVGCYVHATNRNTPRAPLDTAIGAYEDSHCVQADCDCPTPPTTFRCVEGLCRGGDAPAVGPQNNGAEVNEEGARSRAAEALEAELSWKASDYTVSVEETETRWEVTFRLPAPTPPGGEATVFVDKRTGEVVVHPGE